MERLGDILVAMGAAKPADVRAALDNQVVFGGRLGTNLLELRLVSEEALAEALSRRYRCPAVSGDPRIDPAVLALLRADRVERLEVVPFQLEGRRLAVLTADPADLARFDEVAFATGKQIRPVVVPESRLFALMQRHYGVARQHRGILDAPPPIELRAAAPAPDAAAGIAGDLIGEEEFIALYGSSALRAGAGPAPAVEPELPPLGFADAMDALAGVADRDAVARIVLRFARSRFRRAVLLTLHGEVAHGWDAAGEGVERAAVARMRLRAGEPGVVHTVVSTRAHFLGPLLRTEQNIRLLRSLGRGAPRNAFAMPILARERVVNVLYADGGRGELVDPAGVGELLILAARIAQSYEALLARVRG